MDINVTFVIQGINFGISYLFLKYVLLKPAVVLLNNRETEYSKLLVELEKDEVLVQKKIAYKDRLADNFRVQMRLEAPSVNQDAGKGKDGQVTYCVSNNSIDACQETLKNLLVTKAKDAC